MPTPVLMFERLPGKRLAAYTPQDTTTLRHVIRLDVWKAATGYDLCEPLVHELVHLWESHCGYPQAENWHHDRFHERMMDMGIMTRGRHGRHVGYIEDVWEEWMLAQDDLRLMDFVLPGTDEPPKRRMIKYECPTCGFSFHTRRRDVNVVCVHPDGEPWRPRAAMVADGTSPRVS
jgi:hypothetical protein